MTVKQGTPVQLTFYDANDEVTATYSRLVIPWGILKRAVRLMETLDQANMSEADVDAIAGLVVEVFGNQFSVADLDSGADVGEMLAVLTAIVQRARGVLPNFPAAT